MNTLIETSLKITVSAVLAIVLTLTVLKGISGATGQDLRAPHAAAHTLVA
jgi:hypothetical protein